MRKLTALLMMALVVGLLGCSSNDAGGVSEGLTMVNPADYVGVTKFYNPVLSARPLSVDEIGDTRGSYPVQMTFGQKYAVAWAVVDGVPQINNGNAIVGVWRIYESRESAALTSGDVRPGETPTVTVPDEGHAAPSPSEAGPTGNPLVGNPGDALTDVISANGRGLIRPGFVFLSWLDEASDEYRDIFNNPTIHGPCL